MHFFCENFFLDSSEIDTQSDTVTGEPPPPARQRSDVTTVGADYVSDASREEDPVEDSSKKLPTFSVCDLATSILDGWTSLKVMPASVLLSLDAF